VQVGDLVSPRRGRRTHWVGLAIEHRPSRISTSDSEECEPTAEQREGATDYLIQWIRHPRGPAWWVDWSLEVVNASR
jgi:hypothetical protein